MLGEETLLPATDVVRPVPDHFTHALGDDEPYQLDRPVRDRDPDRVLPAGTSVLVLSTDDDSCRVVTASGLAVAVRRANLRELPRAW